MHSNTLETDVWLLLAFAVAPVGRRQTRLSVSVIRKRGMDWETESERGSFAVLGVSGTVFVPVAQDEGLGGRSGPTTATGGHRVSRPDPDPTLKGGSSESVTRW